MSRPAPCAKQPLAQSPYCQQVCHTSAHCGAPGIRGMALREVNGSTSSFQRRTASACAASPSGGSVRRAPPPSAPDVPANATRSQHHGQHRRSRVNIAAPQVSVQELLHEQLLERRPDGDEDGELEMHYSLDTRQMQTMPMQASEQSVHDRRQPPGQGWSHSSLPATHTAVHGATPHDAAAPNNSSNPQSRRRSYHTQRRSTQYGQPPHGAQVMHHSEPKDIQGEAFTLLHPRQLTKLLSQCRSLPALQDTCKKHMDTFNHVHVACAMNRLVKCPEISQPQHESAAISMMHTLESLFVHNLPQYTAREVANAVWCWARVSHQPSSSTKSMVLSAITAGQGKLLNTPHCTPQALANLAWGMAGLKWQDQNAWRCLTDALHRMLQLHKQGWAQQRASGLASQHASPSGWHGGDARGSMAPQNRRGRNGSVGRDDDRDQQPSQFAPVDLASLAMSYATARRGEMALFQELMDVAQVEIHEFCAMDLSNVLWACATMRYTPDPLFQAASPAVQACISGFTSQGVANTTWAYAVYGKPMPSVFGALCRQALSLAREMQPMHYSQLVWAMVRAKQVDPTVIRAAVACAVSQPAAWHTHNLSRLLYSMALGDMASTPEFATLMPVVLDRLRQVCGEAVRDVDSMSALSSQQPSLPPRVCFQDLAQVVWAQASAHTYHADVFDLAQRLCLTYPDAWMASPAALQTLIWSFGYAGHYNAAVFQMAADELVALPADGPGRLSLSQMAGVLVSLGQVQHSNMDAACAATAAHMVHMCKHSAQSVSNATLMTVLWALMLLDHVDVPLLRAGLGLVTERWRAGQEVYMQIDVRVPKRQRHRGVGGSVSRGESDVDAVQWQQQQPQQQQQMGASAGGGADEQQGWLAMEEGDMSTTALPAWRDGDHLYSKQLSQLFQLMLWLQDKLGSEGEALIQELVPVSLRRTAAGAWDELVDRQSGVSTFQQEVHTGLQSLGLRCMLEYLTVDNLFSMDTVVYVGGRYVSVEANGPLHYTRTEPRLMLGSKVLRDRFVRARGYAVLNVPHWEWEALEWDKDAMTSYLRERLIQEVGPAAQEELDTLKQRRQ